MISDIYSIIMLLIAIGLVVLMAFATTYFIGKKSNSFMRNSTIQVIERATIGLQVSINVVLINGKIYILAIQNKTTQVLDIVDAKEWFERKQENWVEALHNRNLDTNPINPLSSFLRRYDKKTNSNKGDDQK